MTIWITQDLILCQNLKGFFQVLKTEEIQDLIWPKMHQNIIRPSIPQDRTKNLKIQSSKQKRNESTQVLM